MPSISKAALAELQGKAAAADAQGLPALAAPAEPVDPLVSLGLALRHHVSGIHADPNFQAFATAVGLPDAE